MTLFETRHAFIQMHPQPPNAMWVVNNVKIGC